MLNYDLMLGILGATGITLMFTATVYLFTKLTQEFRK